MIPPEILKKTRQIEIRTRRLVNESLAGQYLSTFRGSGIEFSEVRPYQFGDDVRTIDWNVTARMGVPFVKRFVEERELNVILAVDASGSGDIGTVDRLKRELAVELAAVLSFAATTSNDRVGLALFTDEVEKFVPPRKGRKHVMRVVTDLLAYSPARTGTDIGAALDTLSTVLKRRSVVFLISDFLTPTESYAHQLKVVARKHDLVVIDLHDPLETAIPEIGLVALQDAETGETVWVDTSDAGWRREFSERLASLEAARRTAFNAAGVDRIGLTTGRDYAAELINFFAKRARRSGWKRHTARI
jgi:uncharacterized protein (DUF58 family)